MKQDPIQKERSRKLNELMEQCKITGVWDGYIRNGFPTEAEIEAVKDYSDIYDVRVQLALQKRAGKLDKPAGLNKKD